MSGYVKIWRSFNEWEWKKRPNTVALFIHLVVNANYKDGRFQGHDIKRGQIVTGRTELCENTGLTEQELKTALKHLKATGEITSKATNKFSIITITNYEKYQDDNQQPNHQATSKQPATNQQLTTRERKKERKKERIYTRPADVSESVWLEFEKLRKDKKAPITETVITMLRNQADEAGWSMEEAVAECNYRGWRSFKSDWVESKKHVTRKTLGYTPLGVGG